MRDFGQRFRLAPRPFKEFLKFIVFGLFPFVFFRWKEFRNWKEARVFAEPFFKFRDATSWKRKFFCSYKLPVPKPEGADLKPVTFNQLAVAIHVFYPEIFHKIIRMLQESGISRIKLYVTVPERLSEQIRNEIEASPYEYSILTVENKGRDILPFLKILPQILEDGHLLVLKIHTKGSNYLNRKELWGNDLFNKLIGNGNLENNLEVFRLNPHIGMLGPAGHILPVALYYGSNALRLASMCRQMGLNGKQMQHLPFIAGSMFLARREALIPLLNLGLTENSFEAENNQHDGTLAHAIERVFVGGLITSGLQLADTDSSPEKPVLGITCRNPFTF